MVIDGVFKGIAKVGPYRRPEKSPYNAIEFISCFFFSTFHFNFNSLRVSHSQAEGEPGVFFYKRIEGSLSLIVRLKGDFL